MSSIVTKWIGSNGEVLIPLSTDTYNTGRLISTKGTYFLPSLEEEVIEIETGNPIGLLLALTYTV